MNKCVSKTKDPRIVFAENRQKATFLNPNGREVKRVKVDGCAITSGLRCDGMLSDPDRCNWYIELKGKGIEHAFKQIRNSILQLNQKFGNLPTIAIIVASRVKAPANAVFDKATARAKTERRLQLKNAKLYRKARVELD
ncbi:MAG: hypothetical protein GDA52_05680 [Rhodobacteraceae bacterium]|nr:hypothetical protein [Paracoccaceae bacterium]